jgi:hypothetical protein
MCLLQPKYVFKKSSILKFLIQIIFSKIYINMLNTYRGNEYFEQANFTLKGTTLPVPWAQCILKLTGTSNFVNTWHMKNI